jgi:hypothetical protein
MAHLLCFEQINDEGISAFSASQKRIRKSRRQVPTAKN